VEELMQERGVSVDHATVNRWVITYSPQLEAAFHGHQRPVWVSCRLDETYTRVKGQWYDLHRAVDMEDQTIDFLLTAQRAKDAALRFLKKAICRHGVPGTITINGSEANAAAIRSYNAEYGTANTNVLWPASLFLPLDRKLRPGAAHFIRRGCRPGRHGHFLGM
jgi:transposase-like protein